MTNERAIELLQRISDSQFDGIHGDERREALEMAVRALEGDGDTISRKMTIDTINNCYCGGEDSCGEPWIYEDDAIKAVEQLPSAQPVNYGSTKSDSSSQLKLNNDLISRRQATGALNDEYHGMISDESMKIYQIINWISALPSAQPTQFNADSTQINALDCVSREQAVAVADIALDLWQGTLGAGALKAVRDELAELPSAKLDCKKGKWIYHSNWEADGECGYECSECGMGSDVDYNYCMRCGAEMRGESDE